MLIKFFNILKNSNNRGLIKNFSALTIIQGLNYLFVLILVPYVVRIIDTDKFGLITYYNEILIYFIILVNFGFEYTATRQISLNIDNKKKINQIFWETLFVRFFLMIFSFCIFLFIYNFSKGISDFLLFTIIFLKVIGFTFLPTWFLTGIEKNTISAYFIFFPKLITAITVFLFVTQKDDYILYALFLSLVEIIIGLSLFSYVVIKFKLTNLYIPDINRIFNILKQNLSIFFNVLLNQYVTLNFFLLGFYVTDYDLAFFGGAFKIIMPIIMITWLPFNQTIYPMMNRAFQKSFNNGLVVFKRMLKPIIYFNLLLTCIIFFLSPFLVDLILGEQYLGSVIILKIFSFLPVLVALTNYFTIQGLYVMNLEKISPYIGFIVGLICITLNVFFTPIYGITSSAYIWIFTQLTAVIITVAVLNKKGLKLI